ncbi:MAG: asparagine--tRNA ligase, partial [Clostridia bacterium]|nr:asparagine--tRNA ligase [Clostridia bacterium]
MTQRTEIAEIIRSPEAFADKTVAVSGWVRTVRDSKSIGFMELNDGSAFKGVQIILEREKLDNYAEAVKLNVSAAVNVTGKVILTPDAKQPFEINADSVQVEGASTPDYPLQKKRHTLEYLRTIGHLRPRANTLNAAFRVRSAAAFALHKFFNERGFIYAHTPLITCSDCEGAGEMFRVTALDPDDLPRTEDGKVDYTADFFGKPAYLTVSGQLQG